MVRLRVVFVSTARSRLHPASSPEFFETPDFAVEVAETLGEPGRATTVCVVAADRMLILGD